ncbi:flotillin domain-containing protein [Aaosphaeria arxii CBS 175.79]|uniref:Flotillin domain-containing protein n=1 Tax=Aaosphaeria arxii CBS 175.79 TaxID=1450172 RepID=A0A6A5XGS3_9PLEO|nr:flotillin domain-containing protein [Aaosphaeria arxii CBS 175.79]KAF2012388.1 flotillin domain-containing protein [Aaosphaeria arxii CBS 175.79]
MWYHVAEPNSYLVITGVGIDKVLIKKKAFLFPFQKVSKISITPFDFSMNIQAMTIEKLKFSLPAVFTIGPQDTREALEKYAVLLTGESDGKATQPASKGAVAVAAGRNHVQDIVKGIIEGETRSIVSTMTMEELFRERKVFKDKVIQQVQSELDQFGLCCYNSNVKELQDTPGSEYFAFLSRKAHEGALNQAKVDVADARMRGEVGEAEKQGKTKQEVAKIHAATAVLETERKGEKATADAKLTEKEISIEKELNLARINAQREAEARDAELNTNVEKKKAVMELERLRATTVTQAKIDKESSQEKADAELYAQEKAAEGQKFTQMAEAEAAAFRLLKDAEASNQAKERDAEANFYAAKRAAEANFFKQEREAEARLITQQREAEGLSAMAKAYGDMAGVLGGPQGLLQYLMLRDGTYESLAQANAKAIQGLQPKINVWNTGSPGDGTADPAAPIRNLFQSLPPLLSTIHDQTGMQPPSWLAQMPQEQLNGHNPKTLT